MIFVMSYLLICNSLLFVLMYVDKQKAVKRQWRIPEKTLLLLGLIGGGFGGLISMNAFRHKTMKRSFKVVYTLGAAFAVFLLIYVNR